MEEMDAALEPVVLVFGILVFLVIAVAGIYCNIDRIKSIFRICRHKATNIMYEDVFENGEHHTYRHYVCIDCDKIVKTEKLQ